MTIWLFLGIACVILDFFVLQSLVLLFFGLGALTAAVTTGYGITAQLDQQIIVFLASGISWCLILWRPLQKARTRKSYDSIIGQEIELLDDEISPGNHGRGKWSGTHVTILLSKDSTPAKKGDLLRILEVNGITFEVSNKE